MKADKIFYLRSWLQVIFLLICILPVKSSTDCDINLCENCESSTAFICNTCKSSSSTIVKINSVCLPNCPYGSYYNPLCTPNASSIIDASFKEITFVGSFGPLITGTSSLTYQPFQNPESVDPIPTLSQGLYFDGTGQYLSTSNDFYPNYKISFCLWINPINPSTYDELLYIKPESGREILSVNALGCLRLVLEQKNGYQSSVLNTGNDLLMSSNTWYFISYTIAFFSGSTTMSQYLNNFIDRTSTFNEQLLRWYNAGSQTLIIGKGSNGNYNGFIYAFVFWNTFNSDFSSIFNKANGNMGHFCDLGKYWDLDVYSCQLCPIHCKNGCLYGNSCFCSKNLCDACIGWYGTCTMCTENASKDASNMCMCNPGYCSFDALTCISCHTGCATWTGDGFHQCTSCLSGFYFLKIMCLSKCPTGYIEDTTNNSCVLVENNPISLTFNNKIVLDTISGMTVGTSNMNTYPNWESSDPIPSLGRGYYFTSSSYMSYPSFILSSYSTIVYWIYATGPGQVFSKPTCIYCISISPEGYLSLVLKFGASFEDETFRHFNKWYNIAFVFTIIGGTLAKGDFKNGVYTAPSQITYAQRPIMDEGTLYIGGQLGINGFTGFLWSLKVYNSETFYNSEWKTSGCDTGCSTCPSEKLCPGTCPFGTFLSSGSCVACSQSCSPYGCRSTDTCRLCKYKECLACTSFDGPCTDCIPSASLSDGVCSCNINTFFSKDSDSCKICDSQCKSCLKTYYFECAICNEDKVLVDKVCLNQCPYGFASPCISSSAIIINQSLNIYSEGSYGIFQVASTSPPIPSYARGLYFSGSQYLQTNTKIYLNYQFSIGMWIFSISYSGIFQKSTMSFNSNGILYMVLINPNQEINPVATSNIEINGWAYLSIKLSYNSGYTYITSYLNNVQKFLTICPNLLFKDASSDTVFLGKSKYSFFKGFIYSFNFWNAPITDFSSMLNPCGSILSTSCLWQCDLDKYYDGSSCKPCNNCPLGCRWPGSCNTCDDKLCSACQGFGPGSCSQCVENASGGGNTACNCNPNYIVSNDGFSCVWMCAAGCANCVDTNFNHCNDCIATYYYLDGMCVHECPTGYSLDSLNNKCVLESNVSFNLRLQNLIQLGMINDVQVGSSSLNTYPGFDDADPIPSLYRGYFFSSNSFMKSDSLLINTFFTANVWFKPILPGNFMLKINENTEIFKFFLKDNLIPCLMITLQDQSTLTISGEALYYHWWNLAFTSDMDNGKMKTSVYINGELSQSVISTSSSPFIDSGNLKIGASSGNNGFTGFLWSLKIFNTNTNYLDEWKEVGAQMCPSELICPDELCDHGAIRSGGGCIPCDPKCSPYGCRSSETCKLCLQNECLECDRFDGPCIKCVPKATLKDEICTCNNDTIWDKSSQLCESCDLMCAECKGTHNFLCSACISGKYLVEDICLNECPYGFEAGCTPVYTKVISETFSGNFAGSYGIFTTASSSSNYNFFQNPEIDDPIPAKQRGLYFKNGKYLKSTPKIYLSHSFTFGFWVRPNNVGILWEKQSQMFFPVSGSVLAFLENPKLAKGLYSLSGIYFLGWRYYSFAVSFSLGATTGSTYINNAKVSWNTINNAVFRDSASQEMIIGKGSFSYFFEGFLYNFHLWNRAVTDFSSETADEICGIGCSNSCLWDCDIGFYKNPEGNCLSCNDCPYGCVRESSCNICDDKLCRICNGFGPDLCESCIFNASGSVCKCNVGYSFMSPDRLSCMSSCPTGSLPDTSSQCIWSSLKHCSILVNNAPTICHLCESNYIGFQCSECDSNYIIDVDGNCVQSILEHCSVVKKNDGFSCDQCIEGYTISANGQTCEICDTNCSTCFGSPTNCSLCQSGYYLQKNEISNICISCEDSQEDPSKSFMCGNQVSKCSNSRVGFDLDFIEGKIIINFSSKLPKLLQKKNFIIKFSDGTAYNSENSSLTMKSSSQYEINTDIQECDLPVTVELKFNLHN